MAYRDDKEAAYARADALQRELDRAQSELAQTKGKLVDTERARDSLAKKLLNRDAPYVAPEPVSVPPRRRSGAAAVGTLVVIGAISGLAVNRSHHHDYTPPPRFEVPKIEIPKFDLTQLEALERAPQVDTTPFTIDSKPSGAKIVALTASGELEIGTTPMTQSAYEWSVWRTLAIDAKGYARKVIEDAPWTDKTLADHAATYKLTRRK